MKRKILLLAIFATAFTGLGLSQGQSTNLEINVTHTEPVPLQAGEYADIWIRVTNTGGAEARNPEFRIEENFPFKPTENANFSMNGGLKSGQYRDFRFQVKVNENAVYGENELKIWKTSGNQDVWIEDGITLDVRTDNRSLIVQDLELKDRIRPGGSAEMNLTFENLANSQFKNIDVSLDTSGLPVATDETTRERISDIGPDQRKKVSFTLEADGDAENGLYNLPINIDYQDQAGAQLSMSESTGVAVGGYPEIDVALEETDLRTPGRGTATIRIVNKGEGQARFAEVNLDETEDLEILSKDSIYLGSMIADDFQTAEFEVYVDEGDRMELPVTVTYRDGEGQHEKQFTVERELYTGQELSRYGLTQSGLSPVMIVLVLAVLGGGVYYWRRRRKKGNTEDES
jgi:hypothetical protein